MLNKTPRNYYQHGLYDIAKPTTPKNQPIMALMYKTLYYTYIFKENVRFIPKIYYPKIKAQ